MGPQASCVVQAVRRIAHVEAEGGSASGLECCQVNGNPRQGRSRVAHFHQAQALADVEGAATLVIDHVSGCIRPQVEECIGTPHCRGQPGHGASRQTNQWGRGVRGKGYLTIVDHLDHQRYANLKACQVTCSAALGGDCIGCPSGLLELLQHHAMVGGPIVQHTLLHQVGHRLLAAEDIHGGLGGLLEDRLKVVDEGELQLVVDALLQERALVSQAAFTGPCAASHWPLNCVCTL
eukprot:SM000322S12512  [mRNA]  locus=s322:93765:94759:- [translate_table: standard]